MSFRSVDNLLSPISKNKQTHDSTIDHYIKDFVKNSVARFDPKIITSKMNKLKNSEEIDKVSTRLAKVFSGGRQDSSNRLVLA